jgi:hypothetical protein
VNGRTSETKSDDEFANGTERRVKEADPSKAFVNGKTFESPNGEEVEKPDGTGLDRTETLDESASGRSIEGDVETPET